MAALLSPFLAIGLVISTPGAVHAATRHSGSQTFTYTAYDGWRPGDSIKCTATSQYRVEDGTQADEYSQFITVRGDCDSGWNIDSSGLEMDIMFMGERYGSGAYCESSAEGVIAEGTDEKWESQVAVTFSQPRSSMCVITDICWWMHGEVSGGMVGTDINEDGCLPSTMGTPKLPGNTSACPWGAPGKTSFTGGRIAGGTWYLKALSFETAWKPQASSTAPGLTLWYLSPDDGDADSDPEVFASVVKSVTGTTTKLQHEVQWEDTGYTQPPETMPVPIIGVQIFVDSYSVPSSQVATGTGTHWPGTSPTRLGMTRPAACEWYFGPKLQNVADTTEDEPFSTDIGVDPDVSEPEAPAPAGPGEPDDTDTSCTFSVTDPSTWLEGGMCAATGLLGEILQALWSLIQSIGSLAANIFGPIVDALGWLWEQMSAAFDAVVDAIGGIASAILDGLGNLLSSLFVPADGFLDNKVGQVQSDLDNTSPGKWVSAIGDFAPGSMSGCEGLPLNVDLGPVSVNEHIGAACSGFMAEAASLVRLAVSAVVIFFGAMACLRAVGSGFGWSPGVAQAGAAA